MTIIDCSNYFFLFLDYCTDVGAEFIEGPGVVVGEGRQGRRTPRPTTNSFFSASMSGTFVAFVTFFYPCSSACFFTHLYIYGKKNEG